MTARKFNNEECSHCKTSLYIGNYMEFNLVSGHCVESKTLICMNCVHRLNDTVIKTEETKEMLSEIDENLGREY